MSKTLKAKIIKFAEDGLIKHLDLTRVEAKRYVSSSNLIKAIDRAPAVVAHYSQEQLVSYIVRR